MKTARVLLLSVFTYSMLFFVHNIAYGAAFYVPEQYATIQEAVNAATLNPLSANDAIIVSAGIYPEQVTLTKSGLTIIGVGLPTIGSSDISIGGFTGYNNCVIDGFKIHSLSLSGVTNAVVKNCVVLGKTGVPASASIVDSQNIVIKNNVFDDEYYGGFDGNRVSFSNVSNLTFKNNVVLTKVTGTTQDPSDICGISLNSVSNSSLINNVIIADLTGEGEGTGIDLASNTNTAIKNNIVYGTTRSIYGNSLGTVISYNDFPEGLHNISDNVLLGANNISIEPVFIDENEYYQTISSPCVSAGIVIGAAQTDIGRAVTPPGVPAMIALAQENFSPGETVTITGADFGNIQGSSYVAFDNGIHGTVVSWSDTQIRVIIPDGVTSDFLKVVTSGGEAVFAITGFSAAPTSGALPLNVEFTYTSTGQVDSCLWDFGDGGTSTEQSPIHTYTTPGTYTVSLTVTGPGGSNTKTITDCITATSCTGTGTILANVAFTSYPDIKIPGIEVQLWKMGETGYVLYATMVTDGLGRCIFRNLPVEFPTGSTSSTLYKVKTIPQIGYAAYESSGITFYHPMWPAPGYEGLVVHDVRLTRATLNKGILSGCVTSAETSSPLANINIELWKRSYTDLDFVLLQSVATNTTGGYSFANLPEIFYHNAPQAILYKVKVAAGAGYEAYESDALKFYNGFSNWVDTVQNNIALTPIPVVINASVIQDAINAASPGDTIILSGGTYVLTTQLKITKNITIKGTDPNKTIFLLGNNNILVKDSLYMAQNEAYYQLYDNLTDVTLENLTITGYTGVSPQGPIEAYVRNYLTLKSCKLVGNKGTRVSGIYYGGTYLWTDATKTALWKTGGVKLVNTLVAGNTTEEGHGYDGPYFPAITTEGTTAYHSGRGVIYGNGGKLEVYNSTIAGNLNNSSPTKKVKYGAMFLKTARLTMENSIMWNNGLDRNDVYLYGSGKVGGAAYSDVEQESITGEGVIHEDPEFQSPEEGNYTPLNVDCLSMGSRFNESTQSQAIQSAIDSATKGTNIILFPDTYTLSEQLKITKNITIKGSDPENTILQLGNNNILVKDSLYMAQNEAYYQLYDNLTDVNLENLTITGYTGTNPLGPIEAYVRNFLTLKNCKLVGNKGTSVSGIYYGGTYLWTDATKTALWKTGGVKLVNTLVAGNTTEEGHGVGGTYTGGFIDQQGNRGRRYTRGVIYANGGKLEIHNSTIADNVNNSATLQLPSCVLYGAIFLNTSTPNIMTNTIMWNNGLDKDDIYVLRAGVVTNITYSDIDSWTLDGEPSINPANGWGIPRIPGEGSISQDPSFSAPENLNYLPLNTNCSGMGARF